MAEYPKCPNCGKKMNKIYVREGSHRTAIGYICKGCRTKKFVGLEDIELKDDTTLNVCPKCFEKIKTLKKRKRKHSMGFWERLMWGNLTHLLIGRGALKHKQDDVSERDHVQYLKTSVSEYIKCREKYLEKEEVEG